MTEVWLEDYTSGWKFQLLKKLDGGWLSKMWLMPIARTPRLYQYKSVTGIVQHVTPRAATAHEIFEINACHGNKFENSWQTTCQLQYISAGLLHYSTWDVHWKKKQPGYVFVTSCVYLLTAKDFQGILVVMWHEHTFSFFFFLHFPDGSYQAFELFFLSAPRHLAVTLLTHCPTWQLFIQQRNQQHCL